MSKVRKRVFGENHERPPGGFNRNSSPDYDGADVTRYFPESPMNNAMENSIIFSGSFCDPAALVAHRFPLQRLFRGIISVKHGKKLNPWHSGKMALLEVVILAIDALAVLGKFIFLTLFTASSVAWEFLRIVYLVGQAFVDYALVVASFLLMFILDNTGVILPYFWEGFINCLLFTQWLVEWIIHSGVEFLIGVWSNPAFINLRKTLLTGIANGTGAALDVALDDPLCATRWILTASCPILLVTYRKELSGLLGDFKGSCTRNVAACVLRMRAMRAAVGYWVWIISCSVVDVANWSFTPVWALLSLPGKTKSFAVSRWNHLKARIIAVRLPQPAAVSAPDTAGGHRVAPTAPPASRTKGPSIFDRFKKSHSATRLELLESENRGLMTLLEEEREAKLCVICQSNQRELVLMPCKHFATCEECMALLPMNLFARKVCPVCRTQIMSSIKVYL
ncbi:hypothetical protein BV898_06172 [Hypsibius exemplaris]|uniref:RING-type domain-containing protein n=1 Tax=Hypsibius exemplaris TaxID=2072580 RepID=A0A1W0WXH5_HYPEX|nr:hypothetical protein BV898_06172 [Hypsibius exemplaris]